MRLQSGANLAPSLRESVRFREAQADDLPLINTLFIGEYGENYPYPMHKLHADGFYVVAESVDGQIVGFGRAAPYHGYKRVWEFGGLIVHRAYRGKGIAREITERRLSEARSRGIVAVVSEPVCYREQCESQHNLLERGFVLIGIQPFKYPDIQEHILGRQPESVMLAAKYLVGDSGFCRRPLYLPKSIEQVLGCFISEDVLARQRTQELIGPIPDTEFHVGHAGSRSVGSEFVDVPANWPDSSAAIETWMEKGFRFCGVLPGFGHGVEGQMFDYIRLYRPPSRGGFRFDSIHVVEHMRLLREFMRRHDPVSE